MECCAKRNISSSCHFSGLNSISLSCASNCSSGTICHFLKVPFILHYSVCFNIRHVFFWLKHFNERTSLWKTSATAGGTKQLRRTLSLSHQGTASWIGWKRYMCYSATAIRNDKEQDSRHVGRELPLVWGCKEGFLEEEVPVLCPSNEAGFDRWA